MSTSYLRSAPGCFPLLLAIATTACGSATKPAPVVVAKAAPVPDATSGPEKIARWRAWEPKELPRRRVEFPDLSMSADLESAEVPPVKCQKLQTGGMVCETTVDLGKDDDGEQKAFGCTAFVDRAPPPFGVLFRRSLGERSIEEVPSLELESIPQGVAARIVVPSYLDGNEGALFGTTKLAVAYGPGYTLVCEDGNAGGNAAFRRIASRFFSSATFNKPASSPLLRTAFKHRRGDVVRGFSIASILQEDEGYFEIHTSFDLESDEKTWHVMDVHKAIERDAKGAVDSMRSVRWLEGGAPIVLSAKPAESGKVRVKLEEGQKSDSLEITPRAPLSTELWEASALLKVSSGKAQGHRYGFLSVTSDREPTIVYSVLSRQKSGVLSEEIDHGGKKKSGAASDKIEKNEISLDERGFATKQVSAESIYERLFLSGNLPTPKAGKSLPGRKTP